MPKKKISNSGFTLLEVLVVVAVFAMTVTMAIDLFLTVTKIEAKISKQQEVENNAQILMEAAVRDVKNSVIDYGFYEAKDIDLTQPTHILAQHRGNTPDFNSTIIRRSSLDPNNPWAGGGDDIEFCICEKFPTVDNQMVMSCDEEGAVWEKYNYSGIKVVDFKLFINPAVDPYQKISTGYAADAQPRVTMTFTAEGDGVKKGEKIQVTMQSTFSLMTYLR